MTIDDKKATTIVTAKDGKTTQKYTITFQEQLATITNVIIIFTVTIDAIRFGADISSISAMINHNSASIMPEQATPQD